jgi:hypothetical protein
VNCLTAIILFALGFFLATSGNTVVTLALVSYGCCVIGVFAQFAFAWK